MRKVLELFASFFKVGIMTFGGGLSMLPILEKEIVDKKNWATREELLDYYAVGQCTPGIIAVNTATFIGHKIKGNFGGVIATLGVICPSVIIILLIAAFLKNFSSISYVQSAFAGIRVAVCALVISSVIGLIKKGVKDAVGIIVSIATFIIMVLFDISPIYIIVASIITGIAVNFIKEKRK